MALRHNKIIPQNAADLVKAHIQGEILILQHTFVCSLRALLRAVRVFWFGTAAQSLRETHRCPALENPTIALVPPPRKSSSLEQLPQSLALLELLSS